MLTYGLGRGCVSNLVAVLAMVALMGACNIKSTEFQFNVDGGLVDGAEGDAPPSGPPQIQVSAMTLTVTEGETLSFSVQLTARPPAPLLVNLENSEDTKLGITPTTLLFTETDWSLPQTVILTGKSDTDVSDETVTVMVRSPLIPDPVMLEVTVDDDDGLALVLTPPSMDIGEGTTGTITARLSAQPQADVVVTIATSNASVATISQPMFTFTTANWAIEQSLVVTGLQDADTANGTAIISFVSPVLTNASATVQVTDDDVLGIATSTSAIATGEGQTQTFTVTLTQQPPATVTVNLAANSTMIATVSPASLSFTTATWSIPQTVTVIAVQDDDIASSATSISLMASGLTTRSVTLTVTDDDLQAIQTTPVNSLAINEGASGSISVRLAYRPANDITVTAASLDASAATVSLATLTFSPSNYTVGQTVSVTGVQDNDAANDATTIRFEVAAQGLVSNVATSIDDDDTLGIDVSATTAAVTEGATTTFMVRLTAQPTSATLVAIASGDTTSVTVSPASLTFDANSWTSNQLVTITGVEDPDLANESVTLAVTSPGLLARNVAVSVTENDIQAFTTSLSTVTVTEGTTTNVGVRLAYQPAANVTVTVASSAAGVATAGPSPLTFTTTSWNAPQNVSIGGVEDADTVNGAANLTLSATGITTRTVPITVTDNDALNIDLSPTAFTVIEGSIGTLQVRLTAQPAAATTVSLASSDLGAATLSVASVSFSTTDWSTYKSVTVSGVQDADAGDEGVTVTASATGLADRTATVTVDDDETLAILTLAAAVVVTEGGTNTFQVRLSAQPGAATTVNLATSDAGAATLSAASLSFDAGSWNTPRTVTVTGVSDPDTAPESVTFTLSGAGMADVTVAATVTDDDTQAILVTPSTRTINEGTSNTVSVTLQFQPTGNYMVMVTSANPAVAAVSPASLTFNAGNYQNPQAVTISGAQDANAVGNSTTVSLTGAAATSGSVLVTVPDDDVLGIELDRSALTINEGGTGPFQVRLTAQPSANTTVNLTSSDTTAATVTGALTFTTGNWNSYQLAEVVGVEDLDPATENVTIAASAPGMSTQTLIVTVNDNDVQSIIISTTSATLREGVAGQNMVSVGIRLSAQPVGDVAVSITSPNPGAVTTSASSRTFNAGNFAIEQFVTLAAVTDANWNFEQVGVNFTATGLAARTTNVFVVEPAIIEPEQTSLAVCEGSFSELSVRLRGNPINPLSVATGASNSRCSVTPPSRDFTSGNFAAWQFFTVTGNSPGPSTLTVSSPTPGVDSRTIDVQVIPAQSIDCGGPGTCGDGTCTLDEQDSCSCNQDCANCGGFCGDGVCGSGECFNCFQDCGSGPIAC